VLEGATYCPRHAGVVRALQHAPEEEREYPDVGNRAPSLCEWMAAALEESVRPLLDHYQAYKPDTWAAPETLTMAPTGTPRVRGWEHRWRLVDATGPLLTIALRVEEPRDSVVIIKINGVACHEAVPPWISDPGPVLPDADQQRRAQFNYALMQVMAEHTHAGWLKMQSQTL
jgi:hypothetical protein